MRGPKHAFCDRGRRHKNHKLYSTEMKEIEGADGIPVVYIVYELHIICIVDKKDKINGINQLQYGETAERHMRCDLLKFKPRIRWGFVGNGIKKRCVNSRKGIHSNIFIEHL